MEVLVLVVIAVLVLALIGFIQVLRWIGNSANRKRAYSPPPMPQAWQPLTRGQKLGIVEEVLGARMPADLAAELGALLPWRKPIAPAPEAQIPTESNAEVAPAALTQVPTVSAVPGPEMPVPAPTPLDVSQIITPPQGTSPEPSPVVLAPQVPVEAVFDLGAFAAPSDLMASDTTVDDSPLTVPEEMAAAAAHSTSKLKLLLSFENIIFLLAACLILGGTIYLLATTWNSVSSGYQYVYAEALLVFYGWVLLATGLVLRRKQGLDGAATVLAALAAAMSVGAAELAAAAFGRGAGVGILGALLAQLLAVPALALQIRLHKRTRRFAVLFGIAIAALSGAGACFAGGAHNAGAWLLAIAVLASPILLVRAVSSAHATFFLVSLAPALGAFLLPTTLDLPAIVVAPALAGLGFACRPARRVLPQVFAMPALFTFIGLALGLGHASLPLLVAVAALGLLATLDLAAEAPHVGLFAFGAGLALFLAFFWTTAFGLHGWPDNLSNLDLSLGQRSQFPIAALGALPWALAGFVICMSAVSTRTKPAVEGLAYLILAMALLFAAAAFPHVGVLGAVAAVATVLLAYGNARSVGGDTRLLVAHALGLATAFLLGRLGGTTCALAAVGAYALALLVVREKGGFWLSVGLVPVLVVSAIITQESHWLPAALLGLFGAVLLRPRPEARKTALPLVLPSLVFALLIALFHAGTGELPLLDSRHLPVVLLLSLVAPLLWISSGLRRAPLFVTVEVLLGLGAASLGGSAAWVLLASLLLLAGRDSRAVHSAAAALLPLALLAIYQATPRWPLLLGLGLAGGLCLFWPLALANRWPRWLGIPAVLATLAVGGFYSPAGAGLLPVSLAVPLFAVGLAPFFVWAVRHRGPDPIVLEAIAGTLAVIVAGAALAPTISSGLPSALATCLAGLALLFPVYREPDQGQGIDSVSAFAALARQFAIPGFLAGFVLAGRAAFAPLGWSDKAFLPLLFALGSAPFFVWAVLRRRPGFVVVESVLATILLVIVGVGCALGSDKAQPSALVAGLAALMLLLPLRGQQAVPGVETPAALAALARWLTIPGFLAGLLASAYCAPAACFHLPAHFAMPLVALGLLPFFVRAVIRRGPEFVVHESVLAVTLLVPAGILCALGFGHGVSAAIVACVAALALLLPTRDRISSGLAPAQPKSLLDKTPWLALPGFLAGVAALGSLVGPAIASTHSPADSATVAAALGLLPFFLYALVRRRPEVIVLESVILATLLWAAGAGTALLDAAAAPAAFASGLAALALGCTHGVGSLKGSRAWRC